MLDFKTLYISLIRIQLRESSLLGNFPVFAEDNDVIGIRKATNCVPVLDGVGEEGTGGVLTVVGCEYDGSATFAPDSFGPEEGVEDVVFGGWI